MVTERAYNQDKISDISTRMTSNLLSLNQSKTELLIGLSSTNIYNLQPFSLSLSSNTPITSRDFARNLGFIFDSSITFSEQISSLSSSCNYHIRDLHRFGYTLRYRYFSRTFSIRLLKLSVSIFIAKTNISSPVQRLISRACTYGAVGSLISKWSLA